MTRATAAPQELVCSLKKSNPSLPLLVLAVPSELSNATLQSVKDVALLHFADDIPISRSYYKEDGR